MQGPGMHIDLRILVPLCKGQDSAGMVIVAVAQKYEINTVQIHSQPRGILPRLFRGPRIHKKPMPRRLYIDAESMLRIYVVFSGRIFH
jgi:hypothetical protein